jgi:cobaltochelatase CobS
MAETPETSTDTLASELPDITVSVRQTFGLDSDMQVPAYSQADEHVPDLDEAYRFDHDTTLAILAGFAYARKVLIQGYHGTGKSTHIEQVAARLNWPCLRINLDSHISRIDLIGKDAIVIRDGKQITEFREGLLPWALQRATSLVFDEYDAGRPDVMFVIQRILEAESRLTLLDQNRVIRPHPAFRLFATAWATPPGSITACSRSTRPRWTAGTSSPPSTTCPTSRKSTSSSPSARTTTPPRGARPFRPWCHWRT